MPSILFICAADRCRSPMAYALLRWRLQDRVDAGWRLESAGIWGQEGQPAIREVQAVMKEMGLDLRRHRSRRVTAELIHSFDLILVMERDQKEALQVAFPEAADKIFLLTEMAGGDQNIPDPLSTGRSMVDFRATAHEIDRYIVHGLQKIIELAGTE